MTQKSRNILLIGDFIVNQFLIGKSNRLSEDGPVPLVEVTKEEKNPMGATVIAETLIKLGEKVTPIGIIGNDLSGNWLKKRFAKLKISTKSLIIDSKTVTPTQTRIISNNSLISRFDLIPQNPISSKNIIKKLEQIITKQLKQTDFVIICDYGFNPIPKQIIQKLFEHASKINILVSTIGKNYLNFSSKDVIIKINKTNALSLLDSSISINEPKKIIKNIAKILNVNRIILTNADEGIVVFDNGIIIEMPATKHIKIDPKGIGDVLVAAMTSSLLSNNDFIDSCKLGNIAAGVAISKGSPYTISKKELLDAKNEYEQWLEQK